MSQEQLRNLFNKMDKSNTGFISVEDYQRSLAGYACKKDSRRKVLEMDDNLDGQIGFDEFARHMSMVVEPQPGLPLINADGTTDWFAVFVHFDIDGSGLIDIAELKNMLTEIGFSGERSSVIALFEKMDKNLDGKISYGEFVLHFRDHGQMAQRSPVNIKL